MDCLNTHQSESLVRLVAEKEGLDIDLGIKGKSGILQSMKSRAVFLSQYGSVKGYAVLETINIGVFIMMPVPLCLTCLDRNFETGFLTTLGLFL